MFTKAARRLSLAVASLALIFPHLEAASQTAPSDNTRPTTRPFPRPTPTQPSTPTPSIPPKQTRPVNRPVTLPAYPERPRPSRPVQPTLRPNWGYHYPSGGRYFAGTIRCESFSGRFRNCFVPTQGRVVLERRHNGRCRYGHGWGYDRSRIWVNHNCRATFAYGIGSYVPRYRSDNNNNTALIIGGVAVAAGLVAVLARNGRNDFAQQGRVTADVPPPARVDADLAKVEARAREGLRACLDRAAADVGATGGNQIRLTGVTIDAMGGRPTAMTPTSARPTPTGATI